MSLRVMLVLLLLCASLATGVAPIVILSLRMDKEVDSLSSKLATQVAQTVVAWMKQLIVPGPEMCDTVVRMFDNGLLSSHLESGLESPEVKNTLQLLWGTFQDGRQRPVKMLYMGTEYDAFLGFVNRGADGIWMRNRTAPELLAPGPGLPAPPLNVTAESSTAYVALGGAKIDFTKKLAPIAPFYTRQRGWYSTFAKGDSSFGWFGPYTYANGAVGLSSARRLYNSTGSFIGVVAADIELDGIHTYLSSSQMRLSPGMQHTVIDVTGNLMGTSLQDALATEKDATGQVKLVKILDPRQPEDLRNIVQHLLDLKNGAMGDISTDGTVVRWKDWYIFAMLLEDSYKLKWIYVLYAPTQDFLGPGLRSMVTAIGICAGFVGAVILVAMMFAYKISRRLAILTEDMKKATALTLSNIQTEKEDTRLREVRAISVEFCKLVNGLRSFRKYLPQDQVGFLLRSNLEANIAAIEEEITVFFLDIKDFTSIVEAMDKADVVHFYGAVMTQITDCVMSHEGTLDKYIGDAVMAFWNMPRCVPGHETKAMEAALSCRDLIPNLQARGWAVDFRVGLSTGFCQVGNFGSKVRLNYTAIGDTVNLASRLEGLCKHYHTHTLCCGSTFKNLDTTRFVIRHIDNVTVKGKGICTSIYEAVAWRSDASDDVLSNCADYEQAFKLYTARAFEEAESLWTRAATRRDQTAPVMLQRLPTVRHQANFDGVWKWTLK